VTIHEIAAGIDDGPIVATVRFSIYPEFDEVRDVYERSLEYGWVLFTQTMPILGAIDPTPQNEDDATYYSKADIAQLGERTGFVRPALTRQE
jgi:methionyl-tRNA formyltransferase